WGFLTLYLQRNPGSVPRAAQFIIGALILWDILFRAQQSVTIGFLEDIWSRNLLNIWVSPIRPIEFIAGTILVGILRVSAGVAIVVVVAAALFGFNFLSIGIALAPFIVLLAAMGWSIGLVAASLILRFGQGVEELAWAIVFFFQPFCAVVYPVSVLPDPLQWFSHLIPASWVFEGMRQVILGGAFPTGDLVRAAVLDAAYVAVAWWLFSAMMRVVRDRGLLSRFGE
ncbi:MAG: ABC transporter permease, partial [Gaiellales bacterium]